MAGGDELAVHPGQGAVVDGELHLDGGRVNGHEGQRDAVFGVGDGLADEYVLETGQADDVAGVGLGDFDAFEALEMEDCGDLGRGLPAVAVDAHIVLAQT